MEDGNERVQRNGQPTGDVEVEAAIVLKVQLPEVDDAAAATEVVLPPRREESPWRSCDRPLSVLLLLTLFHVVIYLDRGSFATNAVNGHEEREGEENHGLRADLAMTNFQNGVLSSLSMVGRLLGCPFAARASRKAPPLVVIGSGMVLWLLAIVSCGLSFDFYFLAACRLFVGMGQAPLITIGTIVIDDIAPEESITTWFSLFEGAGPVGAAVGFFYGSLVGTHLSWQYAFYLQGLAVIPLVVYCFLLKPFDLKRLVDQQKSKASSGTSLCVDIKRLLMNVVFVLSIVGMSLHKGYIVCMEYWAARGFEAVFRADGVDMILAAILLGCSLGGAFAGGRLLDTFFGASVPASLCTSGASLFVASSLAIPVAFALHDYVGFVLTFGVSFLFVFIPLGPSSAATIWVVPEDLRPTSRAVSVVVQQILGAIPAPALYGAVVDWTAEAEGEGNAHRIAIMVTTAFVCAASAFFFCAAIISCTSANDKDDDDTHRPPA